LAGQGLNLGLADVVELGRVLAARETWRSLGDERLLRRYERARWAPARTMERVTDGLWQLFAAEDPLLRGLRNRGLQLVNRVGLAKAWLATRAVQP
jgi:2-polyprenyl-6-methoxyphenol hydroxylase-like FAD-dependent oxidoreductase